MKLYYSLPDTDPLRMDIRMRAQALVEDIASKTKVTIHLRYAVEIIIATIIYTEQEQK